MKSLNYPKQIGVVETSQQCREKVWEDVKVKHTQLQVYYRKSWGKSKHWCFFKLLVNNDTFLSILYRQMNGSIMGCWQNEWRFELYLCHPSWEFGNNRFQRCEKLFICLFASLETDDFSHWHEINAMIKMDTLAVLKQWLCNYPTTQTQASLHLNGDTFIIIDSSLDKLQTVVSVEVAESQHKHSHFCGRKSCDREELSLFSKCFDVRKSEK